MRILASVPDYFLIWLALLLTGLYFRPLTPVDETRVLSVAWEMWQRGDFLVPYLNGLPYSHKPPLLQWCIHLLWAVFGVSEWSARLVAPLFALGNLALTAKLARRLWPDDGDCQRLAPLLLLALPVWAFWSSLTLYDMMVTFFTLLGLTGIVHAAQGQIRLGWTLAALAIAGGVLSKGPVILVMILPSALAAPWWLKPKPVGGWRAWYGPMLAAVLLGALLALAWALPAGFAGGEAYRRLIFWGQSAARINNSFAHKLPFWWYLAWLPVLWLPWVCWPPLWRAVRGVTLDSGLRLCVAQALPVLLLFSAISGKRIHYLLPMFPAAALFAARALSTSRPIPTRLDAIPTGLLITLTALALLLLPLLDWDDIKDEAADFAYKTPLAAKLLLLGLVAAVLALRPASLLAGVRIQTLASFGVMLAAHMVFRQIGWPYYDMRPFADRLAAVERDGAPVAHWLKYNGDFNFLGRLEQPLLEISSKPQLLEWMHSHPQGYVVLMRQPNPAFSEDGVAFAQFYRGHRRLMLWQSAELLKRPETLEHLVKFAPVDVGVSLH